MTDKWGVAVISEKALKAFVWQAESFALRPRDTYAHHPLVVEMWFPDCLVTHIMPCDVTVVDRVIEGGG